MKRHTRTIACAALLGSALLIAACGGRQSMASKSAAAYREAQAKGIQVSGGHEHGGHPATEPSAETEHAAHAETSTADHAAMGHGATAMDHAAMGHGIADHAAHDATAGAHAQQGAMPHDAHAQHSQQPAAAHMDHAQHDATQMPVRHAGHSMGATAPTMAISAPLSNAEMQRIQPATTLRGDAFDAPAPMAVAEATKAQGGGSGAMDHSEHGSAPRANPATAAVYTCPMHPEVTSDKPGTCPKCGMTLVKKNAAQQPAHEGHRQ